MTPRPRSGASMPPIGPRLTDAVRRGALLDLAADQDRVSGADMQGWGAGHRVPAAAIRDILRGVGDASLDADPHGLRIRGAVIDERLDLENINTDICLELTNCVLHHGLTLRDATLPGVVLRNCILDGGSDEAAFDAERLTARAVRLTHIEVRAAASGGAVIFRNGRLGTLNCRDLDIVNTAGAAVDAECLTTEQSMVLGRGCVLVGAGADGAILLNGASIGAQLDCSGAHVTNDEGPALNANNLSVKQDMFLMLGFTATGAGTLGAVRLAGASIGGQLEIAGRLGNDSGPALSADGLRLTNAMMLRGGFVATGFGQAGTIRLAGAHVGQLELDGARILNRRGPALNAPLLHVDKDLFLRGQFKAEGSYELGAIRLPGARLGRLECTGSTITNDAGPALFADNISIDQGLVMRDANKIEGDAEERHRFRAYGSGDLGVVSLAAAEVGGEVAIDFATLIPKRAEDPLITVDGFRYTSLPTESDLTTWLDVLARRTPKYAAQPYQQLAAVHRAAGDDGKVRRTLMAQRKDQIKRRALSRWHERALSRMSGWLLGWGYQPWRALLALLLTVTALIALTWIRPQAYVYAKAAPRTGTCSTLDRVGSALDAGLPLIKANRSYCDFDSQKAGRGLTVSMTCVGVLSWAFATLFVAGFTGIVRRM